jgi:hypothetical protein
LARRVTQPLFNLIQCGVLLLQFGFRARPRILARVVGSTTFVQQTRGHLVRSHRHGSLSSSAMRARASAEPSAGARWIGRHSRQSRGLLRAPVGCMKSVQEARAHDNEGVLADIGSAQCHIFDCTGIVELDGCGRLLVYPKMSRRC